jgi:glutamyl-tRNA reductase
MAISVVGVSHRTAPLEVRERFAIDRDATADVLRHLVTEGCTEAVLLSTCNRTELYFCAPDASDAPERGARALYRHAGIGEAEASGYLYALQGEPAVEHLFRVVASLDSMIVGEAQIQGQVREAYGTAIQVGGGTLGVGPVLARLFEAALRVGARVRTETRLGSGAASIPSAAVELATQAFGTLEGRRAVVVGAGEMSRLALRCLNAQGAHSVLVSSRTEARARSVVDRFGGEAASIERLPELLGEADIVASATAAPHAVITRTTVERAMRDRRTRPLLLLDIALPRDVEPAAGALDGVVLYDLDDLSRVVEGTLEQRRSEIALAECIIAESVTEFFGWYRGRGVVPVIRRLRGRAEQLRQTELDRARAALRDLTPEQLAAVDGLTRQLLAKLLHAPTTRLRQAAADGRDAEIADIARFLFSLDDDDDGT